MLDSSTYTCTQFHQTCMPQCGLIQMAVLQQLWWSCMIQPSHVHAILKEGKATAITVDSELRVDGVKCSCFLHKYSTLDSSPRKGQIRQMLCCSSPWATVATAMPKQYLGNSTSNVTSVKMISWVCKVDSAHTNRLHQALYSSVKNGSCSLCKTDTGLDHHRMHPALFADTSQVSGLQAATQHCNTVDLGPQQCICCSKKAEMLSAEQRAW